MIEKKCANDRNLHAIFSMVATQEMAKLFSLSKLIV